MLLKETNADFQLNNEIFQYKLAQGKNGLVIKESAPDAKTLESIKQELK